MATVKHWSHGWVGSPTTDLYPGDVHIWEFGGDFKLGDTITATAIPVPRPGRALALERVKVLTVGDLNKLSVDVRNVGTIAVPGYNIALTWVRQ